MRAEATLAPVPYSSTLYALRRSSRKYSPVLQGNTGGGWYMLQESWKITKETKAIKHHGTKSYPFGHVGEKKHLMITVVGTCLWILLFARMSFSSLFSTLLFIEGPVTWPTTVLDYPGSSLLHLMFAKSPDWTKVPCWVIDLHSGKMASWCIPWNRHPCT